MSFCVMRQDVCKISSSPRMAPLYELMCLFAEYKYKILNTGCVHTSYNKKETHISIRLELSFLKMRYDDTNRQKKTTLYIVYQYMHDIRFQFRKKGNSKCFAIICTSHTYIYKKKLYRKMSV